MKEIKRFDMRGNTWPSDDGSIVSYKDHTAIVAAKDERIAELQEQVLGLKERLQLVAELNDVASALHVEAEKQVRALAAENSALKSAIAMANSEMQEHYDAEGVDSVDVEGNFMDACIRLCDAQSTIDKLESIETPVTDADLREIRAQAVEGFSEFCGDNSVFIQATCNYDYLADAAFIYLARIRAGEKP